MVDSSDDRERAGAEDGRRVPHAHPTTPPGKRVQREKHTCKHTQHPSVGSSVRALPAAPRASVRTCGRTTHQHTQRALRSRSLAHAGTLRARAAILDARAAAAILLYFTIKRVGLHAIAHNNSTIRGYSSCQQKTK